MRKRVFGRRFKRDTNERKALFRSLMHGMVLHGKIRTTEAKAKSIKGELEKIITTAKNKGEAGRGLLMSHLANEKVVSRVLSEIAPKFSNRPGGYTRIIRMNSRVKDSAKMVLMSWTEEVTAVSMTTAKRNTVKKSTKEISAPKESSKKESSKEVKATKKTSKK